jgi:plasmid stabilization system protein ParE
MTHLVIVAPEARAQIEAIDAWWREHRPASPALFVEELAQAEATLEAIPGAGRRLRHPEIRGLRRLLLRSTRYHLYYIVTDESVIVLAAWSAVRGAGPDLRGPGVPTT